MIGTLEETLATLVADLSAAVAVVWREPANSTEGHVLAVAPRGLLPRGTAWHAPDLGHREPHLVRDPLHLARLLPSCLRLSLPSVPVAAWVSPLGERGRALTLAWCTHDLPLAAVSVLEERIHGDLDTAAAVWEQQQDLALENARLSAVMGSLEQAIVIIDDMRGVGSLNLAAAALLGLPHGERPSPKIASALQELQQRALNPDEIRSVARRLIANPDANISESVWLFSDPPTHLRVNTFRIRQEQMTGRAWVFTDISREMEALDEVEEAHRTLARSRALMRANADGMLDPQVLYSSVRDERGTIVDFVFEDVNRATCEYLGMTAAQIVGARLLALWPGMVESGLFAIYVDVIEKSTSLAVSDFEYANEVLGQVRRYDLRGSRVGDGLSISWRDVTERYEAAQHIAESEARLRAKNAELEAALARVRVLEGIIPICMYCKKIRDDSNQWNMLEQYITDHSDALFSHGLCPDCFKKAMAEEL